jgi:transcriptional regulator with XRE-family HTH domain
MEPGPLLHELRLSRGISQNHLAELARVDQAVVSRLERGADARWSTWTRLFEALGFEASLTALLLLGDDDTEDFLNDGIQRRKDRMEDGRNARW